MSCNPQGEPAAPLDLADAQADDARALALTLSQRALGPPRSPVEYLHAVRELIEDESRWLARIPRGIATEDYAFRPDGSSTWWGDPDAVQWCVGGALALVARSPAGHLPSPKTWPLPTEFDDTPHDEAHTHGPSVGRALLEQELGMHVVQVDSHRAMLEALDRAIRRAEAGDNADGQTS